MTPGFQSGLSYRVFEEHWLQGYSIKDVPADGHCGIHAYMWSCMSRFASPAEVKRSRGMMSQAIHDFSTDRGSG